MQPVRPDQIAPELRAPLAKVPSAPLHSPLFRRIAPFLLKLQRSKRVEGVTISVPRNAPALRLYEPEQRKAEGGILWIHGGGYIIGSASMDDEGCSEMCRDLGVPVVSAEYRLAPRHAFPAPLEDCEAVWHWMLAQSARLGVDVTRIAVCGPSAGGGLAAGLVQKICDGPGIHPVAQVLFAPMLDDRTAARFELDAGGHPLWNNSLNRLGWTSYLGMEAGAAVVSDYAAPARREDLSGLPPSWIGVGAIELFHDEDVDYARRLEAAGVETTLEVVPGAPHGFEAWGKDTQITKAHIAKARAWLRPRI